MKENCKYNAKTTFEDEFTKQKKKKNRKHGTRVRIVCMYVCIRTNVRAYSKYAE